MFCVAQGEDCQTCTIGATIGVDPLDWAGHQYDSDQQGQQ
jgi:hypothetical protein